MLEHSRPFVSFSVDDVRRAKEFYGSVLGFDVEIQKVGPQEMLRIRTVGNNDIVAYAKPDHAAASYTILNFPVDDVDRAVDQLSSKGVRMERYDGMKQDAKGISRGMGPDIAWFKDPAGNVLSVLRPQ